MLKRSIFREIRGSLGRYLAIIAIIALGVGFFAGLRVTKTAMIRTAQDYIDSHGLYDFRVLSTVGFDPEDGEAVSGKNGIRRAEGAVSADFLVDTKNGGIVLRAHSMTEEVNTLALAAGRLPERDDECAADAYSFGESMIGTELTLSDENDEETLEQFRYRSYRVVGLVNSVNYLNYERGSTALGNGSLSGFVYLPRGGFAMDYDTELLVRLEETGPMYSDAYQAAADAAEDAVNTAAAEQAALRRDRILSEAEEEILDGERKLADGWAEYETRRDSAERELAEAAEKLEDGEREIEENAGKLAEGEEALAAAEAQLEDGRRAYREGLEAYQKQRAEAEQKLADAAKELEDARQQLYRGSALLQEAKLDEAEAQAAQAAAALELVRQLYDAASLSTVYGRASDAELREAAAEFGYQMPGGTGYFTALDMAAFRSMGSQRLAEAEAELAAAEAELAEAEEQFAALQQAKLGIERGEKELEQARADAEAQFAKAEEELEKAAAELERGEREIRKSRGELADGKRQLEDARAALEEGRAEYADAKREAEEKLEEARQELLDGERELRDARAQLSDVPAPEVYVLGRNTNVGYACFESDANIVEAISRVFPAFFFFVAALVCITTMTRMVDEQRTQIGVLKALGFTGFAIMMKYMVYSGSASLIGCVLGFIGGSIVFPKVLWAVYQIMYNFSELTLVFDYRLAAVLIPVFMICALGATWFACRGELSEAPAELMRPKAPKSGKRVLLERIPFVWNHMKFLRKVSIRNIFRYKKRLVMMIFGISGCTALLITGFGIRDSIRNVANYQFDDISLYDELITLRDPADEETRTALLGEGKGAVDDLAFVHMSTLELEAGDRVKTVNFVVSNGGLEPFLNLYGGDGPVVWPGPGEVLICDALAERLEIGPGDRITLRTNDMRTLDVTVSGVFKNYVFYYVFVNDETCLDQWGCVPDYNSCYVNLKEGADPYAVSAGFMDSDTVASVMVVDAMRERVDNMLESLDYIVMLVVFCAAMLALIVLYNLTNINITERIREIATIKVLGFYPNETAAYVFRENLLLTAMGVVCGIFLGRLLHAYVMDQIRIDMIAFDVRVAPLSILFSVVLTFAFTVGVNLLMRIKLDGINMAESLKSVE